MPCANHPDVVADLSTCARCGKSFCPDCVISLQGQTVCAACKNERVQDIKSGSTQEDLELAGPGARFVGAFIDGLVFVIPVFAIAIPLGMMAAQSGARTGEMPLGATLAIMIIPSVGAVAYEALMLTARGQTLGKMVAKTKVVRPDGSNISAGQAWGRAVSRILMGATRILGLIDALMVFSKERTTLHDRIAKTRVITWKR
jgi:uncharacterized RDD family membrane protein YckC